VINESAGRRTGLILCGILLLTWTLLPLIWLMLVAILPGVDLGNQPPIIDLTRASLDRFGTLLADDRFAQAMLNSLLAAGGTTIVTVIIASLAAYAISRLEMRGRNVILGGTLATQMVPGIVLVIPVFIIMRQLRLTDTILALILLYTTFLLPYAIWLLQNFFNHVPKSLESAARMDGCSRVGTLFRIILPVSAPGIAATAIFVFISSWNEFLFALVVTSQNATTVSIRLAQIQSTIFGGTDFATVGTAAVLMVLPVLAIVVIFNRYIAYGLTEGAVRG
jgi:multiple sugar transport system permease protein